MSFEELLHINCPEGVKRVKLGEVLDYEQPTEYLVQSTDYDDSYATPVLTAGQSFILGYTDEAFGIYKASRQEPVIIFDDFTTSFHWVNFPFKVKSSAMKMLKSKTGYNLRYIYYAMQTILFVPSEHTRHWISKYSQFEIPLPPLPVQEEIVRMLDGFAALTEELDKEIDLRQKQYEYTRNELLSFDAVADSGSVVWKTLGEVGEFRRGSFPQPYGNSEWYNGEGSMPFVQVADVAENGMILNPSTKQQISRVAQSKSIFVPKGTVIVSIQGSIGRVAITQYDCYVDRTLAIFNKYLIDINKRYFAYQLHRKFNIEKEFARGSTLKTITKDEFKDFSIPLPPLAVQQSIVERLDKMESLIQNLQNERDLRQKQYEHYREQLLSSL